VQVLVAAVGIPKRVTDWFACSEIVADLNPRYVVVMGGGGIPSGSGLIRTYYAARAGAGNRRTRFIVALPADTDPEAASVGRMKDELMLRGVPPQAILLESEGVNTHEQAENIRRMLGKAAADQSVLVVTSPSHARRAVLCFRRAGFAAVSALPAYGVGAEADLGAAVHLRYGFWGNLELESRLAREAVALLYYRVRGWI
jgi:uncharacterized SAM-binding protein YcdF (DUF218 family)